MADNLKLILTQIFVKAYAQNKLCIYGNYVAIACFGLFGTLASMTTFKDSTAIYWLFHYLPCVLILLSIPASLYHIFLMIRYQIIQFAIIRLLLIIGFGLPVVAIGFYVCDKNIAFYMSAFLGFMVWFGVPFLMRVNIKRYLDYLHQKSQCS